MNSAIFWQDLVAAWMTGSKRYFSHETFPELHWGRDPFLSSLYMLPSGFERLRCELGDKMVQIIEDIHAFQHFMETTDIDQNDIISITQLDNQQAWIESRLYDCFVIVDKEQGMIERCIILASYLCAYTLFMGIWSNRFIPARLSVMLLHALRQAYEDREWVRYRYVLLWCTVMGGTFSQPEVKPEYYGVLQQSGYPTFTTTWNEMETLLEKFLWSKKVYHSLGEAFWAAYPNQ
jgi:hypothetical protein